MKCIKKTFLTLLLALTVAFSSVPTQAATTPTTDVFASTFDPALRASGAVNIAMYDSLPFTARSGAELRTLQMDADTISLVGYCDGDETDELLCYIQGWDDDNSNFSRVIPFTADGHTETIAYHVPKGLYKIKITASNSNITKRAYVVFSVLD